MIPHYDFYKKFKKLKDFFSKLMLILKSYFQKSLKLSSDRKIRELLNEPKCIRLINLDQPY